ncbi:MAG: (2Fe-2S) ferredoxin domain-containing protein [Oscillochloris sp.]|nr:(2Fe-2S) ferredoxin domain-containing protein [Oscillochloris sp.]
MGKSEKPKDVRKIEQLERNGKPCIGVCAGKHCARAGAKQIIRSVQATLTEAGLDERCPLVLTKCQDHCDDSPALTIIPDGYPYIEMTPELARRIVLEHIRDGEPVPEFMPKRYRRKLEKRKKKIVEASV